MDVVVKSCSNLASQRGYTLDSALDFQAKKGKKLMYVLCCNTTVIKFIFDFLLFLLSITLHSLRTSIRLLQKSVHGVW